MSEQQKACAAACGSNIIFGFSFLAVSYTHLDVYKRQL